MSGMTRRSFLFGALAAPALLVATKKIFLPPVGGWPGGHRVPDWWISSLQHLTVQGGDRWSEYEIHEWVGPEPSLPDTTTAPIYNYESEDDYA